MSRSSPQQQHGPLAATLAAALAAAERPGLLAAREGSLLRLVPPNERLTHDQLLHQLEQLLTQQPHARQLLLLFPGPQTKRLPRLTRHTAAWLRGCCYLGAGNSRQALRDAHAAMAYATAAAEKEASQLPRNPPPATAAAAVATTPASPDNHQPVTAAATSLLVTAAAEPRLSTQETSQHSWWPALLLAGQACMAALGDHAQAAVHLAEATRLAPPYAATVVSSALQQALRGLSADQGYAWATGGLAGLQQQLQDEADMKLPEVLRPWPKWYYYNQWMRQRIHLALLELHLASDHPPQSHTRTQHLPSTNSRAAAETSTSSTRGRLLLSLLAEGGAEAPAVAAAAAAAGFCPAGGAPAAALALPVAAAAASKPAEAAAGVSPAAGPCCKDTGVDSSSNSSSSSRVLQLPEAVVDKLLSLDAGDLDLMMQHPVALQGQVYELLEVLQTRGPEALQGHPIQPLTWEEVQGLAGGVVGLPLGYTPSAAAAAAAVLPLPAAPSSSSAEKKTLLGCETPTECDVGAATGLQLASLQQGLVRGEGWTRAQYVQQALCAQETRRVAAAGGV